MDRQQSNEGDVGIILLFIIGLLTLMAALYSNGNVTVSFLVGILPMATHLTIILLWTAYILSVIFGIIYGLTYRRFIHTAVFRITAITFFIVSVLLSIAALIARRHFKIAVSLLIVTVIIIFLAIILIAIFSDKQPTYGLKLLNCPPPPIYVTQNI